MKKIIFPLVVLVLSCGIARGQGKPASVSEHLKCFGPFIGTWQYEGPAKEDMGDLVEKDTTIVVQGSYKGILNGSAVELNWSLKIGEVALLSAKDLYGWDAKEERIVKGGMNSLGGIGIGSVTHDEGAKSLTISSSGIDGEGEKTSMKVVVTKVDKDTHTWQAIERTGGGAEGPGPVYTFKRVKRERKAAE